MIIPCRSNITPILRQLARALVDGRDDIRVFRGEGA